MLKLLLFEEQLSHVVGLLQFLQRYQGLHVGDRLGVFLKERLLQGLVFLLQTVLQLSEPLRLGVNVRDIADNLVGDASAGDGTSAQVAPDTLPQEAGDGGSPVDIDTDSLT